MADLQSCYFCGAPEDVSEYAVVPPRLGGGDRSVALCPDCKTKLLRVMEPLIERAEAGADPGNDSTEQSPEPSAEPSTPDDGGITMSPGAATDGAATEGSASTPSGGADGDAGDESAGGAGGAADTVDAGAAADAPPSYRRAMRMLSNRPFPIERTEVESMLATAYDLEREEIDAVLERAEADGRLVAENGEIREA